MKKGRGLLKSTSASRRVGIRTTDYSAAGRPILIKRNLTRTQARREEGDELDAERRRQQDLTRAKRLAEESRRDIHTLDQEIDDNNFANVLEGSALADISNAGGDYAFQDELDDEELLADLRASHERLYGKRRDYRTRRNRTQALFNAFKPQMEAVASAYMAWDLRSFAKGLGTLLDPPASSMVQGTLPTMVVDLFNATIVDIPMLAGENNVSSNYIQLGYFPCSASGTTVVLTTRVLEIYRSLSSISIDSVQHRIRCLHRNPCNRRCPHQNYLTPRHTGLALEERLPGMYVQARGGAAAPPAFLSTKDGNNSLKRWDRREREGDGTAGASKERADGRKYELEELMKGFTPDPAWHEEEDGCSDRWDNMKEHVTSKAWGMYEETGVFLSLCRHGFVLLIADMVRSGELCVSPPEQAYTLTPFRSGQLIEACGAPARYWQLSYNRTPRACLDASPEPGDGASGMPEFISLGRHLPLPRPVLPLCDSFRLCPSTSAAPRRPLMAHHACRDNGTGICRPPAGLSRRHLPEQQLEGIVMPLGSDNQQANGVTSDVALPPTPDSIFDDREMAVYFFKTHREGAWAAASIANFDRELTTFVFADHRTSMVYPSSLVALGGREANTAATMPAGRPPLDPKVKHDRQHYEEFRHTVSAPTPLRSRSRTRVRGAPGDVCVVHAVTARTLHRPGSMKAASRGGRPGCHHVVSRRPALQRELEHVEHRRGQALNEREGVGHCHERGVYGEGGERESSLSTLGTDAHETNSGTASVCRRGATHLAAADLHVCPRPLLCRSRRFSRRPTPAAATGRGLGH
ncbi:hypothetical protein B0H15DRAFT_807633 [Mycena belliarum]|uniref:Uncharacterized protein n=1 Tax=Mycena belliarum TaxID=1033014 RepID=A0AAD6XFN9_9AGAR|nr:hypothetical protein B0H15DRAFT_807633 [Mycena belliae]